MSDEEEVLGEDIVGEEIGDEIDDATVNDEEDLDENYEDDNFDDEEVAGAKDNIDSKDGDDDNYGDDDFIDNDEDYTNDDDNYSMASSEVTTSTTGGKTKKKGKKKGKKIKRKTKKKKKKKPRQSEFDEYDEYDMNPEDRMPDPRMAVRMESARIEPLHATAAKQKMLMRRKRHRKTRCKAKEGGAWRRKWNVPLSWWIGSQKMKESTKKTGLVGRGSSTRTNA